MRMTKIALIVLGVAGLNMGISQAAISKANVTHQRNHIVKASPVAPKLRRVCDWIGPGGRAVYRCNLVDPAPTFLSQNVAASQRTCEWVGPGGRAVYRCR